MYAERRLSWTIRLVPFERRIWPELPFVHQARNRLANDRDIGRREIELTTLTAGTKSPWRFKARWKCRRKDEIHDVCRREPAGQMVKLLSMLR